MWILARYRGAERSCRDQVAGIAPQVDGPEGEFSLGCGRQSIRLPIDVSVILFYQARRQFPPSPPAFSLSTLGWPETPSVLVTTHVGARAGCRRGARFSVCRVGWSSPDRRWVRVLGGAAGRSRCPDGADGRCRSVRTRTGRGAGAAGSRSRWGPPPVKNYVGAVFPAYLQMDGLCGVERFGDGASSRPLKAEVRQSDLVEAAVTRGLRKLLAVDGEGVRETQEALSA